MQQPDRLPARRAVPEAPEAGITILVIEDERFVRDVTCEILRAAGYRVLHAEGATAACRVFRRYGDQIRVLLCDAVLPDSSGVALARSLHQRSASLKVILVSGYPQATVRASPDQQSGDEFLAKPYCAAVLISKVQMALQTEDAPKEAGQVL